MVKIILIGIIISVILVLLKNFNSELFAPALVASGIILSYYALGYFREVFSFFNQIIEASGVDIELYKIIFKIVGISYLVEFGAGTVEDMGYKSISDKLVLIGKLSIFIVSMPIFYTVINLLFSLIK